MEYNSQAHQAWLDMQSGVDRDPDEYLERDLAERKEWLKQFDFDDADVQDDEDGEFILSEGHKIRLPHHLQIKQIYN